MAQGTILGDTCPRCPQAFLYRGPHRNQHLFFTCTHTSHKCVNKAIAGSIVYKSLHWMPQEIFSFEIHPCRMEGAGKGRERRLTMNHEV